MSIRNINAIIVNGLLLIAGENAGIDMKIVKPGLRLTDGKRDYEVVGVPLVRRLDGESLAKNISLELKADGIKPGDLQGKTLNVT